jgi:hypothetical protein
MDVKDHLAQEDERLIWRPAEGIEACTIEPKSEWIRALFCVGRDISMMFPTE